jgi:hypothetical protein
MAGPKHLIHTSSTAASIRLAPATSAACTMMRTSARRAPRCPPTLSAGPARLLAAPGTAHTVVVLVPTTRTPQVRALLAILAR